MATYNPPAFPRRPKHSTPLSETRYRLQLAYYQYQITFALYMMSPGEKLTCNSLVMICLLLCFAAVYYCVPTAVFMFIERMVYYLLGSRKLQVPTIGDVEVLWSGGEAMASLQDAGKVPASTAFEL